MKAYIQDKKNGPRSEKYFDTLYQPLREADGSISGVLMHSIDVTEQYTLMKELETEREKYKEIAENLPNLVWVAEPTGKGVFFNKNMLDFIGGEEKDLYGWGWHKHIHKEDQKRTRDAWNESLHNHTIYEVTHRAFRHDGQYRWILSRAFPLKDEHGDIQRWFGVSTDIHDLVTAQKELEQRKDDFVSLVCHELRTPLASIKGYSQLLERATRDNDAITHTLVKKQLASVSTLSALVSDLLEVSRIQSNSLSYKHSSFDVYKLIADTIELVRNTHKSCKIKHTNRIESVILYADWMRIQQVLINILNNAIKYNQRNKEIVLETVKEGENIIISVQDFGIGIPQCEQDRLFEQFYRASHTIERFSGLGIGLYLSKQIVQHHGGDIWLESDVGKGSTFYIRLPVKKK
jgi:PAS domain S-box-containing protein